MNPLPALALEPPDLRRWRAGNTGTEGVWRFASPHAGPRVAITALIHGNELCGAWAVAGVLELLHGGATLQCGELTLAFCNLAAFDRFDLAQPDASRFVDEDLNRQWSAERMAGGNTLERRRAAELLPWVSNADYLLDLHSMHDPAPPLLLTGMLQRHGDWTRQLGIAGHVVIDAGHAAGVRLRDHGRFGDPHGTACALLVECGGHGDPLSRRVAEDATSRVLQSSGLLSPAHLPPSWRLDGSAARWALHVTDAITARSSDFRFARDFGNLECIAQRGTVIAHNDGEAVTTPYDDCVLVMPSLRQLRPGVTVVRLARREAMPAQATA
jgi:predicted deacylase